MYDIENPNTKRYFRTYKEKVIWPVKKNFFRVSIKNKQIWINLQQRLSTQCIEIWKSKIGKKLKLCENSWFFSIFSECISEIKKYHKSEKTYITIVSAKQAVDIAYGVLVIDENNNFKEISSYEFYVNTGIYILSPNIIDLISLNEKIDMPELLERARKNGKKIKVYKTGSKMIDIGKWDYYKELL